MENNTDKMPEEEINNPDQFKVGRTPEEEKDLTEDTEQENDTTYTAEETEFADGKGSQLDQELGEDNQQESDDDVSEQVDGTFEDQDFGKEEGIQPEPNDI